jgi:hypothetical protein
MEKTTMSAKVEEGIMATDADTASGDYSKNEQVVLKTTKDGLPLVPQPSDDPDDPLVCCYIRPTLSSQSLYPRCSARIAV